MKRWKELLIAFLMAFVLWYGVTGSEKVESQVDVRVDYRGLPQGLTVSSGFVGRVSARLRAPAGMIRSLTSRDYAFFMDLSGVHKGENVLPVSLSHLPFRSGVEVMEVNPSRIVLEVDELARKTVPLEAVVSGALPGDMGATVTFEPQEVTVSGAAGLLRAVDRLRVPVQLDGLPEGETVATRVLPLPEGLDASPVDVRLTVTVGVKHKRVKVTRQVEVHAQAGFGRFVRPDKVTLTLNVPESAAGKAASNPGIRAFVDLASQGLGSHTVPVQLNLPERTELVGVDPPKVTVTLEQRQALPKKK